MELNEFVLEIIWNVTKKENLIIEMDEEWQTKDIFIKVILNERGEINKKKI